MRTLKENSSIDDWVGSMILFFKSPKYNDKTCFIVEGHTDVSFLNSLFPQDCIHYDSPCSGKGDVITSVSILRESSDCSVYGICDADFDTIENKSYENIYLTDCHDLEMMLIAGGVLDKCITEHLKHDFSRNYFFTINEFKSKLIASITHSVYLLGLLKWVNYKNSLNLNFKGMSYNKFVSFDGPNAQVNLDNYISHILSRSNNKKCACGLAYLHAEINKLKKHTVDPKHICNGHDFTYIMSMAFKLEYFKNKNVTQDNIETNMRLAYSLKSFKSTLLYTEMFNLIKHNV